MFSSCFRSCVMMVPRKAAGLHRVDWGFTQDDGGGLGWVLPEVRDYLHYL